MSDFGKETVVFFEIDQPFCTLTYGQGACTAVLGVSGAHKCYNTRFTTQKPANYSPGTLELRFARPQEGLLQYGNVFPCMVSPNTMPLTINIGAMDRSASSLGQREVVTATFHDFKHSDHLVDKYRLERRTGAASLPAAPFDPYERGTFWSKWIARNPFYANFRCRVREGFIGQALADMRVRHYVIDRVEGPTDGQVRIVAKDLFSRIEARKAVAPVASKGELAADITAAATSATLAPAGIGNAEYPASGHVAIGDEIMSFTRSGDTLTLTRAQLGTVAADHKDEDLVQVVLSYVAQKAHDIVHDLLVNYTPLVAADIDKPAWDVKAVELTELYTGRIATPTPVNELVGELAEQAGFTVWPDVETGKIEFAALRPKVSVALVNDRDWIVDESLSIKRQDARRASQVWVYYAQSNPIENLDEKRNYRSRIVSVDLAAEGDQQYGAPAIREVFSRWIPQFGRQAAEKTANRILTMYRDPPLEAQFSLYTDRAGEIGLADLFELETAEVQDERGALQRTLLAAVSIKRGEDGLAIRGQELTFSEDSPGGGGSGEQIIHIENDSYNLNLRIIYDSIFQTPTTETVRFIVDAGVKVGSTSTGSPAMRTGSWPAGVTLKLENLGRIQGKGGGGGQGGGTGNLNGSAGAVGGDALLVERALTIINANGQIWSGGGGGGGGAASQSSLGSVSGGGGGGGGAGTDGGPGGLGGSGNNNGSPGASGTPDASGAGGTPRGANGGGPGEDGAVGGNSFDGNFQTTFGGAGGSKGKYVSGNSFVTWTSTGDVRGAVS